MGAEAPQNLRPTQLHTVLAEAQAGSTLWVRERAVPPRCGCSSPAWPHTMGAGTHTPSEAPVGEEKRHMGTQCPVAASAVTLTRHRI